MDGDVTSQSVAILENINTLPAVSLAGGGGAGFVRCVYKPQPTTPTHSALKVLTDAPRPIRFRYSWWPFCNICSSPFSARQAQKPTATLFFLVFSNQERLGHTPRCIS